MPWGCTFKILKTGLSVKAYKNFCKWVFEAKIFPQKCVIHNCFQLTANSQAEIVFIRTNMSFQCTIPSLPKRILKLI